MTGECGHFTKWSLDSDSLSLNWYPHIWRGINLLTEWVRRDDECDCTIYTASTPTVSFARSGQVNLLTPSHCYFVIHRLLSTIYYLHQLDLTGRAVTSIYTLCKPQFVFISGYSLPCFVCYQFEMNDQFESFSSWVLPPVGQCQKFLHQFGVIWSFLRTILYCFPLVWV